MSNIVGFSGSRNVEVLNKVDKWYVESADIVVHGGATGYDTLINDYAKSLNKVVAIIRPNNPSIPRDYYLRNKKIVELSNVMCFNWNGKSKGTKITMDLYMEKVKSYEEISEELLSPYLSKPVSKKSCRNMGVVWTFDG